MKTSRYAEAIADYTKAIDINPKTAEAFYNRAIAYYNTKQYAKAIEDIDSLHGLGRPGHEKLRDTLQKLSKKEQ